MSQDSKLTAFWEAVPQDAKWTDMVDGMVISFSFEGNTYQVATSASPAAKRSFKLYKEVLELRVMNARPN